MSGATKAQRSKLGGLRRNQVIRDLALSGVTQKALAEKYGVAESSMSEFASKHAEAIAAVRADADNEFAGILIAQKAARLEALQEIAEIAMTPVPKVSVKGDAAHWINPETGQIETVMEVDGRLAAQAMKQAAEEMGQLPTRVQISGGLDVKTNYTIEGVSPDELR